MKIRVLGCSGAIAAGHKTTAFLLDDDVLIDAGTGVGDLSLAELSRIDHIFITHSHLDHVLAIALLADAVLRARRHAGLAPIQVHALPETLDALRQHIFNGVIWPDFTRLPSPEAPILQFRPFQLGEVVTLGERSVEVLSASHTVPSVGFAVRARPQGPAWVFTGDTGPNPQLWARLQAMPVAHLVIETAFGDEEQALAAVSQHHCPATLAAELQHLPEHTSVHITHIKPGELDAVMSEIAALNLRHPVQALHGGQVMALDD